MTDRAGVPQERCQRPQALAQRDYRHAAALTLRNVEPVTRFLGITPESGLNTSMYRNRLVLSHRGLCRCRHYIVRSVLRRLVANKLSPDSSPKQTEKSPHSEQDGATHSWNPPSRQIIR
jgi:hypothetical protein